MEYALSLGSNLGDRIAQLNIAKRSIAQLTGVSLSSQSSVYETAAVGVRDQYKDMAYLNAVLIIDTELSPESILNSIHDIEAKMGRIRTEDRFAPRPIDIDILLAGNTMSDCDELTLPHPRWADRRFVVQPLADVRPNLIFPDCQKSVSQILKTLPPTPKVELFTTDW